MMNTWKVRQKGSTFPIFTLRRDKKSILTKFFFAKISKNDNVTQLFFLCFDKLNDEREKIKVITPPRKSKT